MSETIVSSMLGRRQFLGGLAAAAAGGAVLIGPGRGLLDGLPLIGSNAQPFTRTTVLERLGETFRISDGVHQGVKLTLSAIAELPSTRLVTPEDQFAARFTAPGAELASDMYWFATNSFGKLPLYISPLVDADGVTRGYEALVNRYVPPAMAAYLASQEARS